ncbi:sensor histidine kinase [Tistrella mobilis]|uniref:histidine kinase n=1 Tax=Tistrella mobilis (strain KA081020-065) TaxID=1110502 RepID=I3TJ33_TISMK|nr:sensor histidine kinase [Tistrella mobilis]AFK52771.1 Na+/solute symporter [Tistrella mobilis KA081020-065]
MLQANLVITVCLLYVAVLFTVAFICDRQARAGRARWSASPLIFTLSISVYCTSWTFFGAVGSAARSGLEFATIYIGPTIVFTGWWVFLRKLVTVGRVHNTTSIADLISARFGKNPALGAVVTLVALVVTTPYIALQLQALTASFQVITFPAGAVTATKIDLVPDYWSGAWVALGLAVFSIMFGVRNIDVNERHHGVIAAIALEAVVKLVALLAVGLWVVFWLAGSPAAALADAPVSLTNPQQTFGVRWITLCILSGAAIICLPRQFQVTVVENSNERQLRTASWLFPLYLFVFCLLVVPIAVTGLNRLPPDANPDLYVLTLPLDAGQDVIALMAFIGGFSSATSMVIVSSIALSTMISNHIVTPLALRFSSLSDANAETVRSFILGSRRASILFIILLGFLYFRLAATAGALADIGLISFCGAAQFLPALVGGLYWRRATHKGALAGMIAGFLVWAYMLFLPSFQDHFLISTALVQNGPFGWAWLKPRTLFGLSGLDPLVHAAFWSLFVNTALFVVVSMMTEPTPLARLQSALFIDVFRRRTESEQRVLRRTAPITELRQIADRVLGPAETVQIFVRDRRAGRATVASDELITAVEQRLAAHIGAASARTMISRIVSSETISVEELKRLAGETERIRAYSAELERKSQQIESTAAELARANARLREVDKQKDDFLSQISHELRTPMASIRSFSDILLENQDLDEAKKLRFLGIIQNESLRLTRLLDGILDMNLLETRGLSWSPGLLDPEMALDQAIESCEALALRSGVVLKRGTRTRDVLILGDRDKLAQVMVNLIANAIKYNTDPTPQVVVSSRVRGDLYEASVRDNGRGVPEEDRERIFEKFARGSAHQQTGAGLGLAISRQIVESFGGRLGLGTGRSGAEFVVSLPLQPLPGTGRERADLPKA